MPFESIPFTMPRSVNLHKWKDAAAELELALWKSELVEDAKDDDDGGGATTRAESRSNCGADIVIPNVLPVLSGFEVGSEVEPVAVGAN